MSRTPSTPRSTPAGLAVRAVRLDGWDATFDAVDTIALGELWRAHHDPLDADGVSMDVNKGLHKGRAVSAHQLAAAMAVRASWRAEVEAALTEVGVLALPTLVGPPPPLTGYRRRCARPRHGPGAGSLYG
jgi:amidase